MPQSRGDLQNERGNYYPFVMPSFYLKPDQQFVDTMRDILAIFIVIYFMCNNFLTTNNNFVILAHAHGHQYRCSHVPPTPEQVNHVWLEDSNFTLPITTNGNNNNPTLSNDDKSLLEESHEKIETSTTVLASKFKRHIGGANSAGRREKDVFAISSQSSSSRQDNINNRESNNWHAAANISGESNEQQVDNSVSRGSSIQDSLWNLLKKLERPILSPLSSPAAQNSNQKLSNADLVPMQIQVYYDSSVYSLEKKKFELISELVIPSVVNFFENVLSIKRKYTIDRFRIARKCPNNTIYYAKDLSGLSRPYCMDHCEDHAICGEMVVPREHLSACSYCTKSPQLRCTTDYSSEGQGVANTQLLLYVSAKQTARCKRDQTIAYAAHCAQDSKTDRPVAGHANLCPMSISTDPRDLKALISTVKHELTHVLGFSVSLFAYYRDENGKPLLDRKPMPGPIPVDPKTGYAKWSDKVIRKVVRRNWLTGEGPIDKEIHLVVTPTVVREVRRHFNCSTLEGAELEDQGSDGTSMTHWEKRLFENEAMTGTHTSNSVYSRITLAVLQDTGWYVANFSRAQRLEWGKDLGCEFATKSCKSWIDERRALGQSIRPFCDRIKGDILQIACTEDQSSKAVCNLRKFNEPLPGMYQNFNFLEGLARDGEFKQGQQRQLQHQQQQLAYYGGSVDLADYCPFIQEFTWQAYNLSLRGSGCNMGTNTIEPEKNAALEHYSLESRCFEHGRRWEQRTCQYKRSWHHFGAGCYKYSCTNNHLLVIVGNHSYPCYYQGQTIHVEQIVNQWVYNGSIICPNCEKICPTNKCQIYDKRIIDIILNRAHNGDLKLLDNNSTSRETGAELKSIFDESFNMIDNDNKDGEVALGGGGGEDVQESMGKYLPILIEATKLVDHRKLIDQPTTLRARLAQEESSSTPYIFTFPIIRTTFGTHSSSSSSRHPLVCSSGISLFKFNNENNQFQLIVHILTAIVSTIVLQHYY